MAITPLPRPLAPARLPAPESRFDRGAAAVLAFVLVFVAGAVFVTLGILALPSDGWQIPGNNQITQLASFYGNWPTPLRAGDIILAVNGLNVNSSDGAWLDRYDLPAWQAGGTVTYTVRRAGQVIAVPVTLQQADQASLFHALGNSLTDVPGELSWPLIALVVFALRPGSRAARLLLVMMVCHFAAVKIGWANTILAVNFSPAWLFDPNLLINNFWIWLFWPCLVWLVLSFPLPVFPLTRWPRAVPALLLGFGGAGLVISALIQDLTPVTIALVGELALLLLALVLAIANSLRRRDDPVARAQVAWIILGVAVSLGLNLALYLVDYVHPFLSQTPPWVAYPIPLVLPLCLAIAILRYRLFDVAVVIRRTLLYSALTALLAGIYFGSVVVLQAVFTALTGAARSELVTVLSTLAIAALFVPLRARLQAFIDRRFFRRKYDSAQTLAQFSATLRDEVNLDRLRDELARVVDETMQPESVTIWLPIMDNQPSLPAFGER